MKICESTKSGGLGIKNLVVFNQALLGKWRNAIERGLCGEGSWTINMVACGVGGA